MKKHLLTTVLYTVVTTIALGLAYPLVITGIAQVCFHDKANGQLIISNGVVAGSRLIGQSFTSPGYFHGRPSAAGNGYDASNSSGSNLASTNKSYIDGVNGRVAAEASAQDVPIDLVTASASGLDPDISPAAALFQVTRVAKQRGLPESSVRELVLAQTTQRQFGLLGEPRVNVLQLNLALDTLSKR